MNPASLGRFTATGGSAVEHQITELVKGVGESVRRTISDREMLALLVIGGYGRGEGGVDRSSGVEQPHNNIDFMLVTPDERQPSETLKKRLDDAVADQERASGIGFDVSVTSLPRLKRSPSLVIWYDIRFGHKTVLGSPDVFTSLAHFSRDLIPAWDVRNLLTNRGTLLLINDHMLARARDPDRRMLVRHAIKAIIGYGDALLFFLGDYHWSYREKQHRMATRRDVPAAFRDLYEGAMTFRFEPRYESYLSLDLTQWLRHVRQALEPIHLACEARRLGVSTLAWDNYLALALRRSLHDAPLSTRTWARKGLLALRATAAGRWRLAAERALTSSRLRSTVGALCSNETSLLSILFPVVAYECVAPDARRFAQRLLRAASPEPEELRSAYLHAWARHGDINFGPLLAKIEGTRAAESGELA